MAAPHIFNDPFISIDGDEYVAESSEVSLTPANIMADMNAWATPGVSVASGLATWRFRATMKITFDATTGTWNQLNALYAAGAAVTVLLRPDGADVAATNPLATFSIYPPAVNFIEARGPGQTGTLTIDADCYGEPVFTVA